jgi:hypothetical protein
MISEQLPRQFGYGKIIIDLFIILNIQFINCNHFNHKKNNLFI